MRSLHDIPAPAKLNLFLHVVGRRVDGYHLLQTVFRFIDATDRLHLERRDDGRIVRAIDLPDVPESVDLSLRAARALQAATGCTAGVNVALEKHLPAGGGLGGGSSDAASVLIALNRLWGTGLSRAQLMQIGLGLGADVPVFVFGRNAFAEGVGEALQAVDLPPRWYVVVQPDASVPTVEAFRAPDLTRDTPVVKIADFSASLHAENAGAGQNSRHQAGESQAGVFGRNDLEPVVFARFGEVARVADGIEALLDEASADSEAGGKTSRKRRVRMSGSGACLFTEHATREQALATMQEIAAKIDGVRWVQAVPGLNEHPLLHWLDQA